MVLSWTLISGVKRTWVVHTHSDFSSFTHSRWKWMKTYRKEWHCTRITPCESGEAPLNHAIFLAPFLERISSGVEDHQGRTAHIGHPLPPQQSPESPLYSQVLQMAQGFHFHNYFSISQLSYAKPFWKLYNRSKLPSSSPGAKAELPQIKLKRKRNKEKRLPGWSSLQHHQLVSVIQGLHSG